MAKRENAKVAAPNSPSPVEGEELQHDEQQADATAGAQASEEVKAEAPVSEEAEAPADPQPADPGKSVMDFEPSEYPVRCSVINNTPVELVFPAFCGDIFKPYSTVTVTVNEKSQLDTFKSDVAHLSEMHGWTDAFTVAPAGDDVSEG